MSGVQLPTTKDLSELLEGLLQNETTVSLRDDADGIEFVDEALTAYIDDSDQLACVVQSDLPFICYSAAALAMLPPGRAEELVGQGAPDAQMLANHSEVLNILTQPINDTSSVHVRINTVQVSRDDMVDGLGAAQSRNVYEISIDRYGTGLLAMHATR